MHGSKPPSSRLHSKNASSLAENPNEGLVSVVDPEGPESICVSGGIESTVKVREAGLSSTLPAASLARTSNVWTLEAKPEYAQHPDALDHVYVRSALGGQVPLRSIAKVGITFYERAILPELRKRPKLG